MPRTLRAATATAALLVLASSTAMADWNPKGSITMLIGFAAGAAADTQARLIAEEIERRHGWKIVARQATGDAEGLVTGLRKGAGDGTVIGVTNTQAFGYDMVADPEADYSQADITALSTTAGYQMGVVALASSDWNDLGDVIADARAGEEVRFGAMSPKLADIAFLIGDANGVEFSIMEVRDGEAVMNGVYSGEMDVGFMSGIQTRGVLAGELVNLASALSTPLEVSPEAPRISTYGVEFDADGYLMFVGPAGMPSQARKAVTNAIVDVVEDRRSEANRFITDVLGGVVVFSGHDLDRVLVTEAVEAERLLAASH